MWQSDQDHLAPGVLRPLLCCVYKSVPIPARVVCGVLPYIGWTVETAICTFELDGMLLWRWRLATESWTDTPTLHNSMHVFSNPAVT